MLGRGVLSRLHTLTQEEGLTLTLYVDIDQNKQANRKRGFAVQAEAMLKVLKAEHGPDRKLADASRRALDLVKKVKPKGLSALVVVNLPTKTAELHQLQVPLAASVHWRQGAFLRPIVEAMDEHERYAVVLTSTQRARIFTITMGELTEHDDLISDTGRRTKATGSDQWRAEKRHDRRHDEEVTLHAKRVIDALHDLALRGPFDRLILAGTPKATAQLERLLPRRLQGKLVRTIAMPMTATTKEVMAGILKIQERMERDQETIHCRWRPRRAPRPRQGGGGFRRRARRRQPGPGVDPGLRQELQDQRPASATNARPTHPTRAVPASTAAATSNRCRNRSTASASRSSKWEAASRSSTARRERPWPEERRHRCVVAVLAVASFER